jgi:hypothetical protein
MPSRKIELSIMDNDLTTLTDEELDAVAAGQATFRGRGTGSATGTKSAAVTITVEGKTLSQAAVLWMYLHPRTPRRTRKHRLLK